MSDALFGNQVFCTTADGQRRVFSDFTELDKLYLSDGFRPASLHLRLYLNVSIGGRVEEDTSVPSGQVVVISTAEGERRVMRGRGDYDGLGVEWHQSEPAISNFNLNFGDDVREELMTRRTVWVEQGKTPKVSFAVLPPNFEKGETISDIIEKAKRVVEEQLLCVLPQAA